MGTRRYVKELAGRNPPRGARALSYVTQRSAPSRKGQASPVLLDGPDGAERRKPCGGDLPVHTMWVCRLVRSPRVKQSRYRPVART